MPAEIPLPIMFNPYKHHFRFLLNEIEKWKQYEWSDVSEDLLSIGNNLIDFYLGSLSVNQLCAESINFFHSRKIISKNKFKKWIHATDWKKIELSDQSKWLIKFGNNDERFIHIHPAKFSKHTIRVRATTLKTVIALMVNEISSDSLQKHNLLAVNTIRKERLGLSPIKSLHTPDSGIMRLWLLFEEAM